MSAAPAVALSGRRRLSAGELDMVLAAHERFVGGRPGGKLAALKFIDFSGMGLSGRDLRGADLSASIFNGAELLG
ncbi:MAG TPA: pentapeptide repeat-containing protein, partial [Phenylobacterium sp.]|nr:pentapeptide repeat-containing protein [Phenylobacterium sp.]